MAVGFGFSIGDLFAGLKLIKDSIDAVHDTKGSPADYASLVTEIVGLQNGLEAVKDIEVDQNLTGKQAAALGHTVHACHESIDEFLSSIAKYQPHLSVRASGLKSNYRKIKWALCKKDDIAKFRSQLGRHASSINMLLITYQATQNLGSKRADNGTIAKHRAEHEHVTEMLRGLSLDQRQIFVAIMQQNKQLTQSVEDLNATLQLQACVPPQVLLQSPVLLLDPFGKTAPFHLEFINSLECFMAVLKVRFSNAGVTAAGLSKLEHHDFIIQDSQRKRPIQLKRNWASVFLPGQNVDMSMVFHRFVCPPSLCPVCMEANEDYDEQTYCQSCGLCYQNVQAISGRDSNSHLLDHDVRVVGEEIPYLLRQAGAQPELRVFRPTQGLEDQIFKGYRRIQIVSQHLDLLDRKYPALQLIEDFSRFAELLKGIPNDTSAFLPEIRLLHGRAIQHILQQKSNFPAFASFSQIEEVRKHLVTESLGLRCDIDRLVQNLCSDPDTKHLMRYIKETYPSDHGRDYYTGVLTRMVSISEFNKSNNTKVRSAERMQWLLFDCRSR